MPDIRTFLKRFKKDITSRDRDLTMRQVLSVRKTKSFPSWKQWKQLPNLLSRGEKQLLAGALSVIVLALATGGITYITAHRIDIPAVGGEYTEGLIGEPQFINPLYAVNSDTDQDLASLIYSGLVRWVPGEGFVPDLADSIQINEDGTIYTLRIRNNAKFHNGDDVRARDVVFTVNAIQNPAYRSPLIDQFYNITVVQEDDQTVSFILKEPFAPFIENLTFGILPTSLWADILPQSAPLAALNLQPIGSGPYKFASFAKDKKGSIRTYTLERNSDYYLDPPFIQELTFKFYPDIFALHEALSNKNIEGASTVGFDQRNAVIANKNTELLEPFIPRETILYFNQTLSPALGDVVVRKAIASAIDKGSLVSSVYQDRARVIHSPILSGMVGYDDLLVDVLDQESAKTSLEDAGYALQDDGIRTLKKSLRTTDTKKDVVKETTDETTDSSDETTDTTPVETPPAVQTLHFNLTTVDRTDMHLIAEGIQADLRDVGIDVSLNYVPAERMGTEIVDTRNFELLLAPIMLEADPDPFAFWHSTQTKGTGLNLVGYASKEVDTLLEDARKEMDMSVRAEKYITFQELLAEDVPAVFLYQSSYGYALSKNIHHPALDEIMMPSDRFAQINQWYIKTKKALR